MQKNKSKKKIITKMIFIFVIQILSFDPDTEFYLETSDVPPKRINITNLKKVRATEINILNKKTEAPISTLNLKKVLPSLSVEVDKYKMNFGKICLGKNAMNEQVVVGTGCKGSFTDWSVIDIGDDFFKIKLGEDCMTVVVYDDVLEGNFIHLLKCIDTYDQMFRIKKKNKLSEKGGKYHSDKDERSSESSSEVLKEIEKSEKTAHDKKISLESAKFNEKYINKEGKFLNKKYFNILKKTQKKNTNKISLNIAEPIDATIEPLESAKHKSIMEPDKNNENIIENQPFIAEKIENLELRLDNLEKKMNV